MKIDHVGVVCSLAELAKVLGWEVTAKGEITGILCKFYGSGWEELIPVDVRYKEAMALVRFIERTVSPIHHIALEVQNIEDFSNCFFITEIMDGAKPNMRIRFLDPGVYGGILVELVDYRGGE